MVTCNANKDSLREAITTQDLMISRPLISTKSSLAKSCVSRGHLRLQHQVNEVKTNHWRSSSLSVLVSSPDWTSWPDVKPGVWPLQSVVAWRGVQSHTTAGIICHLSLSALYKLKFYTVCTHWRFIFHCAQWPLSVQALYSTLCPILTSSVLQRQLRNFAAKFKPLMLCAGLCFIQHYKHMDDDSVWLVLAACIHFVMES